MDFPHPLGEAARRQAQCILGLLNLNEKFLFMHLQCIHSYFTKRAMNPLLPISILLACLVALPLWQHAFAINASAYQIASSTIFATLLSLTILELLKLITWLSPMWVFAFGVIATGVAITERWQILLVGVLLVGPMVCATSQAINDCFDRHVDTINEPNRAIPSGRIPGRWGLYIAILWTGLRCLLVGGLAHGHLLRL